MAKKKTKRIRLTARDQELITWIATTHAVATFAQIQELLQRNKPGSDLTPSTVRGLIHRLAQGGLVDRASLLHTYSPIVWPTFDGWDLAERPRPRKEQPGLATVLHAVRVADVRLALEAGGHTWHPVNAEQHDSRADGEITHAKNGLTYAIEVELNRKTVARWRTVIQSRMTSYDKTQYFCSEETFNQYNNIHTCKDPKHLSDAEAAHVSLIRLEDFAPSLTWDGGRR
jgi:hypothetical protein